MPDRYNIEIRRIRETDQADTFKTTHPIFNLCNTSGTLKEYWQSDVQCGGPYAVYVLIEAKNDVPIGLIRIRDDFKGNPTIPELNNRPALYLSRFGVLPEKCDYHLGRVLLEYFFFLAKSKIKEHSLESITAYWTSTADKKLVEYYKSFGAVVVRETFEEKWGPGVIMSTELFFDDSNRKEKVTLHRSHKSGTS